MHWLFWWVLTTWGRNCLWGNTCCVFLSVQSGVYMRANSLLSCSNNWDLSGTLISLRMPEQCLSFKRMNSRFIDSLTLPHQESTLVNNHTHCKHHLKLWENSFIPSEWSPETQASLENYVWKFSTTHFPTSAVVGLAFVLLAKVQNDPVAECEKRFNHC